MGGDLSGVARNRDGGTANRDVALSRARGIGWPARVVWIDSRSAAAEGFRDLALRVRRELDLLKVSSLLVTSALPREGKTLTACNLALALASLEPQGRVALVELDLRRPALCADLALKPEVGVERLLHGEASPQEAALRTDARLDVIGVRDVSLAAHEPLAGPALGPLIRALEADYRYVVCDGPPTLPVPDAQLIAPHVGACLLVVRSGQTPRSALREVFERIPAEKWIGSFLNDARPPRHARRYYKGAYYSEPRKGAADERER